MRAFASIIFGYIDVAHFRGSISGLQSNNKEKEAALLLCCASLALALTLAFEHKKEGGGGGGCEFGRRTAHQSG